MVYRMLTAHSQGYDLQLGTNCLGPWLFTHHLHPILKSTAASSPPNSVRVAWAGSLAIDTYAPNGGVTLNENGEPSIESQNIQTIYGVSKAGNLFLASEFGKRTQGEGIVSVCFNPGNLRTELQRHVPKWQDMLLSLVVYRAVFGAYTELWCGLSPDLTTEQNGAYVAPWGRIMTVKKDRMQSLKTKEDGGSEKAKMFVDWCERECKKFM
jgi:retinol dehydrogenase 12